MTETDHGVLDYLVVTSDKWWNGLKPELRDKLATLIKEVTETRNTESYNVNQANKKSIIDAGGTVRTLTEEQRNAWVEAMKPVWKKFEGDIGKELMDAAVKSNEG